MRDENHPISKSPLKCLAAAPFIIARLFLLDIYRMPFFAVNRLAPLETVEIVDSIIPTTVKVPPYSRIGPKGRGMIE